LHCGWCDSAGTWHPDYVPDHIEKISSERLLEEATQARATRVVITGGEPCIHDLRDLVNAFHSEGIDVHLETSGAFPIRGYIDWITLSPKRAKLPLEEVVECANELKFIIEQPGDVEWFQNVVDQRGWSRKAVMDELDSPQSRSIWLHPEWSKRNDPVVLQAISDAIKNNPDKNYRAGYQLHKLYRVDTADPRSRPAVPLGGNPQLGY
jgi:organic radical activating enzyme